ncbi:E3 ubiquitin-protein ligase RNF139-like [Branchiostoma floridae]|uniref:E3 ubiquitin-protein ligase RNF139-like n=2 Tax=Branchiostoma floridae TaxID=7739 RepID=A0A9J7MNT3_BRAFL|nr:E3 ubiquitin-protein ligase RNF139-like [Branchiostoma floridae]
MSEGQEVSWQSRVRAIFDVVFRVPSIYVMDCVMKDQLPIPWDTEAHTVWRITGFLVAVGIFVLTPDVLFRVYSFIGGALIVLVVYWWNCFYIAHYLQQTSSEDAQTSISVFEDRLFIYGIVFIAVMTLLYIFMRGYAHTLIGNYILVSFIIPQLAVLTMPRWVIEMSLQASLVLSHGELVTCAVINAVYVLYLSRFLVPVVFQLIRTYGIQAFVESTWIRLHIPDVLRVFWLTRLAAQAVALVYFVTIEENDSRFVWFLPDSAEFWEILKDLLVTGCDSTLTISGMSAVIAIVMHNVGLLLQRFLDAEDTEEKRIGTVSAVLFFILAVQTGLTGLDQKKRLVRLGRNMGLLTTAIFHFIHNMVHPRLMTLSAQHTIDMRRHYPPLTVSAFIFFVPFYLIYLLWSNSNFSTWLLAVTVFTVELLVKVLATWFQYALLMIDARREQYWEKLDDYLYYIKSTANSIEFVFGIFLFLNGSYVFFFESGGTIRAVMMCMHAYFNIWVQGKEGWKTFMMRRTAVKKINALPEATAADLTRLNDVCAICYQELSSARITPCKHYFHAMCLRKWLYVQDHCPMCHRKLYQTDEPQSSSEEDGNPDVLDFEMGDDD